jgi:hypothetical protein
MQQVLGSGVHVVLVAGLRDGRTVGARCMHGRRHCRRKRRGALPVCVGVCVCVGVTSVVNPKLNCDKLSKIRQKGDLIEHFRRKK